MKTALLGSKAIGLAALDCLSRHSNLLAAYTIDDRADSRSTYADLTMRGAVVRPATDLPDVDLVVVAGWYELLPAGLIKRMPFIGIHHSLLPRYRGGSPLVWAMIRGEHQVGTTLFQMTNELDAGSIWGQQAIAVPKGAYIGPVLERLNAEAIVLLQRILTGDVIPQAQDHTKASWVPSRKPSDGLIDRTRPAEELERFIRAQSRPYPGAFLHDEGGRTIVWRATAFDDQLVIEESERAVA